MNNLFVRILTALIAGTVVVAAIYFSQWGLLAFCAIVSILGLVEFFRISHSGTSFLRMAFILLVIGIWVLMADFIFRLYILLPLEPEQDRFIILLKWLAAGTGLLWLSSFLVFLFHKKQKNILEQLSKMWFGMAYILLPFILLFLCSVLPDGTYWYRKALGILFLNWTLDSMAYFGGRFLGKHKLFERISPKKTWEGSLIGIAFCIGLGFLLNQVWPVEWNWLIVAIIISVFSQLGDLIESMFKRGLSLKDSGGLLPGHGGILDRFDGILFSMPVIFVYLLIAGN